MTLSQRIRFYQQLAVLARAGVPLRSSLERLQGRISGREIAILSQKITAGEMVGDAFIAAGFSPFECHLVAAGERSAQIETVFEHLAEFWKRQREMFQAMISPLYYPLAVLNLAVLAGSLLELTTVPWPVAVTHLIMRFVTLYAAGFVIYTLVRISWSSEVAQRFWLMLPLIGSTLSTAYAYRWITAMRIEYSAGVPLPNAVADAWRASGYVGRESLAREGEAALREGTELSALVLKWKRLPRDWIDFIETGEISGALETAFENLEAEAARSWLLAQQRLTNLLPKILYFIVLLITAVQLFGILYQLIVAPIINVQSAVDDALNGK